MTKKRNIGDITEHRDLVTSKNLADQATKDLVNSAHIIENLRDELRMANEKIQHLEDMLQDKESIPDLRPKPHEEEIILTELRRMHDAHVLRQVPMDYKEDVKKLESLVKSLVLLRNGKLPKTKKEADKMSIDEALRIMTS